MGQCCAILLLWRVGGPGKGTALWLVPGRALNRYKSTKVASVPNEGLWSSVRALPKELLFPATMTVCMHGWGSCESTQPCHTWVHPSSLGLGWQGSTGGPQKTTPPLLPVSAGLRAQALAPLALFPDNKPRGWARREDSYQGPETALQS